MRAGGPFLLGLDVGTLSTKGVLVDLNGLVLAQAVAEHSVHHPQPNWMEHDVERDWWGDAVSVLRLLLAKAQVPSAEVAALCVSGLFPALCAADKEGRPLRNAILYADSRAAAYVERVSSATGTVLKGDEVLPKLLWLQAYEPEIWRQTRMIFSVPGYVAYRLTGAHTVDTQTAYRLGGIVDDGRRHWREDVCAELDIPLDLLPAIHSPLDVIGAVTPQAASETGLCAGTPVLAGTTDTFATLVGNGIVTRGEAMIYYGTTGLLTVCSQDLVEVLASPQLLDGETPFILAAYLLNFGEVIEWYLEQFADPADVAEGQLYRALEEGATGLSPGCDGLLAMPHFGGRVLPRVDPYARGAFFGLTTRHNRSHLWRALLESFGYCILQSVLRLKEQGISLGRVVASGGGARSELWRQIVSDITGLSQEYVVEGDAALGAAFLAGYALGLMDDFRVMQSAWLRVRHVTRPCPENHEKYGRLFSVYQELDSLLGDCHRALIQASCDHTAIG